MDVAGSRGRNVATAVLTTGRGCRTQNLGTLASRCMYPARTPWGVGRELLHGSLSAWSHLGLPRVALFLFFTALGGASRIDLLRRTDYNAGKEMVVRFISDNHNTAERMSATRGDVDNKGSKHAPFFTACPRFGSCPRLGYCQVLSTRVSLCTQ